MVKGKAKTKPSMQGLAALTPSSRLAGALQAPFSTRWRNSSWSGILSLIPKQRVKEKDSDFSCQIKIIQTQDVTTPLHCLIQENLPHTGNNLKQRNKTKKKP